MDFSGGFQQWLAWLAPGMVRRAARDILLWGGSGQVGVQGALLPKLPLGQRVTCLGVRTLDQDHSLTKLYIIKESNRSYNQHDFIYFRSIFPIISWSKAVGLHNYAVQFPSCTNVRSILHTPAIFLVSASSLRIGEGFSARLTLVHQPIDNFHYSIRTITTRQSHHAYLPFHLTLRARAKPS